MVEKRRMYICTMRTLSSVTAGDGGRVETCKIQKDWTTGWNQQALLSVGHIRTTKRPMVEYQTNKQRQGAGPIIGPSSLRDSRLQALLGAALLLPAFFAGFKAVA